MELLSGLGLLEEEVTRSKLSTVLVLEFVHEVDDVLGTIGVNPPEGTSEEGGETQTEHSCKKKVS